ncbi:MAG: ORC1-type DNA replication protein [Candidatus Aenigmarchaeota archaeon]|nr:ORC1-type DNA replication protein [Candidatus Aenigmarchaeota archaeon]
MSQKTLKNLFETYMTSKTLFKDKNSLTIRYTPDTVPHREEQINLIGGILAPALKGDRPSNIFIYGMTGTGKTLVTQYVTSQLKEIALANNVTIDVLYVNCKMKRVADTEYRLIAYLASLLGKKVPPTGLPTDQVYKIFFEALEEKKGVVILVLDEIDALIEKVGDELLYTLTRINQDTDNSKVTIVGISNNLSFTENMDARVKSSLSDEEMIFPPYNALQIKDILLERAEIAFTDDVITDGVIQKCAALAAQEHGDARRALNLLRVSGELAERQNMTDITLDHVDCAESKIDMDHIIEAVKTQPKQSKILLKTIFMLSEKSSEYIFTGDVFDLYVTLCDKIGIKPLTQRRISDLIAELDMLSIINTKVISRGRHGRTRTIRLAISGKVYTKVSDYLNNEFDI